MPHTTWYTWRMGYTSRGTRSRVGRNDQHPCTIRHSLPKLGFGSILSPPHHPHTAHGGGNNTTGRALDAPPTVNVGVTGAATGRPPPAPAVPGVMLPLPLPLPLPPPSPTPAVAGLARLPSHGKRPPKHHRWVIRKQRIHTRAQMAKRAGAWEQCGHGAVPFCQNQNPPTPSQNHCSVMVGLAHTTRNGSAISAHACTLMMHSRKFINSTRT